MTLNEKSARLDAVLRQMSMEADARDRKRARMADLVEIAVAVVAAFILSVLFC